MGWELTTDESGNFDDEQAGCLVLGGVLWAGPPATLARDLKNYCDQYQVDSPIHATDVRRRLGQQANEVLRGARLIVGRTLGEVGGWVIALKHDRVRSKPWEFTLHARLLGDLVTLAARVVAASGSGEMSCYPASRRTGHLTDEQVQQAREAGFSVVDENGERFVRGVSGSEVREALLALRREPTGALPSWPALGTIDVRSASSRAAHAGIAAADLLCNELLRAPGNLSLGELEAQLGEPFAGRLLYLERESISTLLNVDRSLRDSPPDLWGAARCVARLQANAKRGGHIAEGAARFAEVLWSAGLAHLAKQPASSLLSQARALAARCEADLAAKTGAYEGCWLALRTGWIEELPLGRAVRAATSDRELAARLWKLVVECANHRGDYWSAMGAADEMEQLLARGRSLRLLAEELEFRNLCAVTLQNALPAGPEKAPGLLRTLRQQTLRLRKIADDAASLLELSAPVDESAASFPPTEQQTCLAVALGRGPFTWAAPDRERGRLLGTVARSHAFLGELDEALGVALEARRYFANNPQDLAFNATVILRMLAEQGRLGHPPARDAVQQALSLVGQPALNEPEAWASSVRKDPSLRFALDALVRAMLWAPGAFDARLIEARTRMLRKKGEPLLELLSTGELRSHPSELLARHIGELLGAQSREGRSWLQLSVSLCSDAEGGAILAFKQFSERLLRGESSTGDPPGSVCNPTFEYR